MHQLQPLRPPLPMAANDNLAPEARALMLAWARTRRSSWAGRAIQALAERG